MSGVCRRCLCKTLFGIYAAVFSFLFLLLGVASGESPSPTQPLHRRIALPNTTASPENRPPQHKRFTGESPSPTQTLHRRMALPKTNRRRLALPIPSRGPETPSRASQSSEASRPAGGRRNICHGRFWGWVGWASWV